MNHGHTLGKHYWILGGVGSFALVLYTLTLGHAGDTFHLLRRFGVVLFLFCSFILQVVYSRALSLVQQHQAIGQKLIRFSAFTLSVAMFSLVLDAVLGDDYNRIENAFEWTLIMLLLLHLFIMSLVWRGDRFVLSVNSA